MVDSWIIAGLNTDDPPPPPPITLTMTPSGPIQITSVEGPDVIIKCVECQSTSICIGLSNDDIDRLYRTEILMLPQEVLVQYRHRDCEEKAPPRSFHFIDLTKAHYSNSN